ncbi:MAG: hypothetical protein J2P57_21215 [Acidimicrobiaceae bacterium]|nr:hypothetical protein [Acidimicrobiaceae bacterium]
MLNLTSLVTVMAAGSGGWNPFKKIAPSFGPFRPILESRVNSLLALAWIIALCYLGFRLVTNLSAFGKAKKGRYGTDLSEAKEDLAWSAGAIVAVAAIGSIYGALVAF